jgi:alpha-galactosidase
LLDIVHDMEELCPNALFINYVNPMAMNQWALSRSTSIKTVGLCHSVPHTAQELARDIAMPYEDLNYLVAGINHVAFFLKFESKSTGESLYPLIQQVLEEDRVPHWNLVRYDLFKRFGYFITESSEHLSEYVPWYIKSNHPELIEEFNIPLDEYIGRCEAQIAGWHLTEQSRSNGNTFSEAEVRAKLEPIQLMPTIKEIILQQVSNFDRFERSAEYGSQIIHSMETGIPCTIYGNVSNTGIITNLPAGCCVEVPCLVDRNGVQPTMIGDIPVHLAALMQTNINVQSLVVEAALTQKREHIYHAAMLDPHTASELTLDQIWSMVDELLDTHQEWLPEYAIG